jgi:SAM-dependent methyltransferase
MALIDLNRRTGNCTETPNRKAAYTAFVPRKIPVIGQNTGHSLMNKAATGSPKSAETTKMIEVNVEQAKYYDSISLHDDKEESTGYATHKKANLLTRVWASLRYQQQAAFASSGVQQRKEEFHKRWIEKKKGGNYLELGCFRGTGSSWPLIEACGSYLGIDLSANATDFFNRRLQEAGLGHKAKAKAVDFLVMETTEKYDLIFAHGVLHHFEDPDPLFDKIASLLKDDGILLLTEPSQVNPLYAMIRSAYRPFQSDSAWEWPFTRQTVTSMERHMTGVDGFGWGRFSLPLSVMTSIPLLGQLAKPFYVGLLKSEINAGWSPNVWRNSAITAVYKKRVIGS